MWTGLILKGPEGLRHTRDDNIKMNTKETGYEDADRINVVADGKIQWLALQNIALSLWVP